MFRRVRRAAVAALALAVACGAVAPIIARSDWTTYHLDNTRSGNDTSEQPLSQSVLTWVAGLDENVFGTPVAIGNIVVAATENNTLYGLDLNTGARLWANHVGAPVLLSNLPCGDISPLGITGTPVIDPSSRIVWAVAEEAGAPPSHHLVGVSVDTGQLLHDNVIDPPGQDPTVQQQRPALALANGDVYIEMGGLDGDCGAYHGYVIAASATTGQRVGQFEVAPQCTNGLGGGIWGPSGPAVDGSGNLYISTGNSCQRSNGAYDNSDGVIKLNATLGVLGFFAPAGWFNDNAADLDLGSIGPVLLSGGLVFQTGKTGVGYVLNQANLGGIGGQLTSAKVCPGGAYGGNAYDSSTGIVYVPCTNGINAWRVDPGPVLTHVFGPIAQAHTPPILAGGALWATNLATGFLYGFSPSTGAAMAAQPINPASYVHFASLGASRGHLLVGDGTQVRTFAPVPPPPSREVTIIRRPDGNTDLFLRGRDGGGWHAQGDTHGNPASWEPLGGGIVGAPNGTWFNGELEVFAVGIDYQVYVDIWRFAGGWTGWSLVAGGIHTFAAASEEVTSTRRGNGSIDLFIRGVDYAGWHAVTDQHGSLTNGWENLGGVLRGDPDATWSGSTLLVLGIGSDHGLFRNSYTSGWNGWSSISGSSATLTSEHATVTLRGDGNVDLFVLGTDLSIWHAPATSAGSPGPWERLGGRLLGTAWGCWGPQGQLDVVAIGGDTRPWGLEYAGGWSGWHLLPGGAQSG